MLNLARTALQRLGQGLPAAFGGLGFRLPAALGGAAAKTAVAATPAYAFPATERPLSLPRTHAV